jgi:FkbM family methyltransferase
LIDKNYIKQLIGKTKDIVIMEIGCAEGLDTSEFINVFSDTEFKLYCFEPDKRNIKSFRERINHPNVELIENALSDKGGITTFHNSTKNQITGEELIYSGSLRKPNKVLFEIWPQFNESTFEDTQVMAITLDGFCKSREIDYIDFIWMDVQGCEDLVINGGKDSFLKKAKYLYTEYSDNEIYKGEPTLQNILNLLPTYEIVKLFPAPKDGNVLLVNKNVA